MLKSADFHTYIRLFGQQILLLSESQLTMSHLPPLLLAVYCLMAVAIRTQIISLSQIW